MMPHEAGPLTAHSEFEDLQEAERVLKRALTVVDWSKVPIVFSRKTAKAVLAMVSEEIRDRSRMTMIVDDFKEGEGNGAGTGESSQV